MQISGAALYRAMRGAFRTWGDAYAIEIAKTQIDCSGFGPRFDCISASSTAESISSSDAAIQAQVLIRIFEALSSCKALGPSSPYSSFALSQALGKLVTQVSAQVDATVCVGPGSTASAVGYVKCFSQTLGRSAADLVAKAMIARGCFSAPRSNELQTALRSNSQPLCCCTGWVKTKINGVDTAVQTTITSNCDAGDDVDLPATPLCGGEITGVSKTALQALALKLIAQTVQSACGYSNSAAALYDSVKVTLKAWGKAVAKAAISAQASCSRPSSGSLTMQCASASVAIKSVVATESSVLAVGLASAMNECSKCNAMASVDVQSLALTIVDQVTAAYTAASSLVCIGQGSTADVKGFIKCHARTISRGIAKVILSTMIEGGCFSARQGDSTLVAEADVRAVTQIDTQGFCKCKGWHKEEVHGSEFLVQTNITTSCVA